MSASDLLLIKLKEWPAGELESFAAKLLILAQPKFHGNKTIHYAGGYPKKIVDTVTRDI
jgi:hypothetical protein